MSVEDKELKCYEYVAAVKHIAEHTGQGIYGLDKIRTQTHDKLCELFNLTKEDTLKFTGNLDLNDSRCAENLYFDLRNEQHIQARLDACKEGE
jgi:hypothetical protein